MPQAMESALAQSFTDFEMLVADDGSYDGSAEIINYYAKQDKRISWWRNETRLGIFANYNCCMERAAGVYIKPFAQDDLWAPQLLSQQVDFLNEYKDVVLVAAKRVLINKLGEQLPHYLQPTDITDVLGAQQIYPYHQVVRACLSDHVNNLIGEPCALLFRKSARGSGFLPVFKHAGDLEFCLRILKDRDLGMINEPMVFFRKHTGSGTAMNVTRLLVYSDIVHLADALGDVLAQMNCSKEEFIERNIAALAKVLTSQFKATFDLNAIDRNEDYDRADVTALKRAFMAALSMLNEANRPANIPSTQNIQTIQNIESILRNQRLLVNIENLEQRLRELLGSPSWQITRPLREFNKLVPHSKTIARNEFEPDVSAASEFQPASYVQHLQEQIETILKSRSWHYTRFLRSHDFQDIHNRQLMRSLDVEKPYETRTEADTRSSIAAKSNSPSDVNVLSEGHISSPLDAIGKERLTRIDSSSSRPYDLLLAVHDTTRTGAPMLALALAKNFVARELNCLVVLKGGGELTPEFVKSCDVLNLSQVKDRTSVLEQALQVLAVSGLLKSQTPVFVNSAELHDFSQVFNKKGCRVISLIHEFLSNYPQDARKGLLKHSVISVFSSQSTLSDARKSCPIPGDVHVIPQGILEPNFGTMSRAAGKAFLYDKYGIDPSTFVVLSCGRTDQRKGVDIFSQVAKDVLADIPERGDLCFIWIGENYPAKYSVLWWCKTDLQKNGIDDLVHFVGAQIELEPFFVAADVFLLSSRQDPLPCVLHLAQAASVPVVAFQGSGGVEEALSEGGGTLVEYGNVAAMSDAIMEYYYDNTLRIADGAKARAIVSSKYRMEDYVDSLLALANGAQNKNCTPSTLGPGETSDGLAGAPLTSAGLSSAQTRAD